MTPIFTLNLGLRYDMQHINDNPYGNNALDVPDLKKIVIFGSKYPPTNAPQPVISLANRVPSVPLYPVNKMRTQWFNTTAFTAPAPFTYRNSAYNLLFGPRYQQWDISLVKNTALTERVKLQLRADAFNTFNHPNFANPNATLSNTSNFGQITGTTGQPRTMAIGAKILF